MRPELVTLESFVGDILLLKCNRNCQVSCCVRSPIAESKEFKVSSKFAVIRGIANHISTSQIVSGNRKNVSTTTRKEFRIDGKVIRFSGDANVNDGDDIEISGKSNGGEFKAFIIINHTTGVKYGGYKSWLWLVCLLMILPGAVLSVVIIGIPILIWGLYFAREQIETKKAEEVLSRGAG